MTHRTHPRELALGLAIVLCHLVRADETTPDQRERADPRVAAELISEAVLAIGGEAARATHLSPWLSADVYEFWRCLIEAQDGWWREAYGALDDVALELIEEFIGLLAGSADVGRPAPDALTLSARARTTRSEVVDACERSVDVPGAITATRTFVPLVDGANGVTLPCTVAVERSGRRFDPTVKVEPIDSSTLRDVVDRFDWRPFRDGFADGIRVGVSAAARLVSSVTGRDEALNADITVVGLLPPVSLRDRSAGLPIALRVLEEVFRLPMPAVVATGPLTAGGRLLESDDATIEAKLGAVREHHPDCRLLVLPEESSRFADHPHVVVPSGHSLEDAAQAVWGADWEAVVGGLRRDTLDRLDLQEGWVGGRSDGVSPWGQLLSVPLPVEASLHRRLSASEAPEGLILSGPPLSGRTWIAQTVASLLDADGWQVHALTCSSPALPDPEQLIRSFDVIRASPAGGRTVVFVDGVHVLHDQDVERLLKVVVEKTGVHVVLVIEPGGSSAERFSDAQEVFISIAGPSAIREFARAFCRTDPRLESVTPLVPTVVSANGPGDLGGLVRQLVAAAQDEDARITGVNPRRREMIELTREQRLALGELAVLSMNRLVMPPEKIRAIPPETLRRLGAAEGRRGWFLASAVIRQEAVYWARAAEGLTNPRDYAAKVLVRHLKDDLRAGRAEMAWTITRLADAERPGGATFDRVVEALKYDLDTWATLQFELHPTSLMLHALGGGRRVNANLWGERLHNLITVALSRGADARSVGHGIRCLHRLEGSLSGRVDDIVGRLLDGDLDRILRGARGPSQRMPLVQALAELERDDVDAALGNLDDVITRLPRSYNVDDLYALLDFDDVLRHTSVVWTSDGDFAALEAVKRVLATTMPARDTAMRFAQLAIARRVTPPMDALQWDFLCNDVADILVRPGPDMRLTDMHSGLNRLLQADRYLVSRALGISRKAGAFRADSHLMTLVQRAMPGELAAFLDGIRRVNPVVARDILFEGPHIRHNLAQSIAERIRAYSDGRGAGLILRATADVDDLFAGSHRFSDVLGGALGSEFVAERVRYESRASVLGHLVRGLVRANVDFSDVIVSKIVDAVGDLIEVSDRPWAPELVLALGKSEHFDDRFNFFERIAERLGSPSRLLELMRTASDGSIGLFHELGRRIDDVGDRHGICSRFADSFIRQIGNSRIGEADIASLGPGAVAVWKTLRQGGAADENRARLFDVVDDRFRATIASATAGAAAATISALKKMDASRTRALVAATEDQLVEVLLRDARRGQPQTAELVAALDRVDHGIALRAMNAVVDSDSMHRLVRRILEDQHPVSLGNTVRKIERVRPGTMHEAVDPVLKRWRAQASYVTSPFALASMMRTAMVIDPERAHELAGLVNTQTIGRRLTRAARGDLIATRSLVAALVGLDRHAMARDLLAAIASLRDLATMAAAEVIGLFPLGAELGVSFGLPEPYAAAVSRAFTRRRLADYAEHLVHLGALAADLPQKSRVGDRPAVLDLPLDPQVPVWTLLHVERDDWVVDELNRRLDDLVATPPEQLSPWAAGVLLLGSSSMGRTHKPVDVSYYPQAVRAGTVMLRHLIVAAEDPTLAPLLPSAQAELERRRKDPHLCLGPAVVLQNHPQPLA